MRLARHLQQAGLAADLVIGPLQPLGHLCRLAYYLTNCVSAVSSRSLRVDSHFLVLVARSCVANASKLPFFCFSHYLYLESAIVVLNIDCLETLSNSVYT